MSRYEATDCKWYHVWLFGVQAIRPIAGSYFPVCIKGWMANSQQRLLSHSCAIGTTEAVTLHYWSCCLVSTRQCELITKSEIWSFRCRDGGRKQRNTYVGLPDMEKLKPGHLKGSTKIFRDFRDTLHPKHDTHFCSSKCLPMKYGKLRFFFLAGISIYFSIFVAKTIKTCYTRLRSELNQKQTEPINKSAIFG